MKIYVAARWIRMKEMAWVADQLKALGHEITAQWVYGAESGKTREQNAIMDMEDVRRSDLVISFTHPREKPQHGGGRHVEFGMAAAWGKQQWIVGPREQIFHDLPGVKQFDTVQEVFWELGEPNMLVKSAA